MIHILHLITSEKLIRPLIVESWPQISWLLSLQVLSSPPVMYDKNESIDNEQKRTGKMIKKKIEKGHLLEFI